MNNKFILKLLARSTDDGFTIIDVIIGILVAFLFLMASLQAMVVEAYFRMAGQASSEGLLLIQQDLEEVRFKAATLTQDNNKCNATTANAGYAKYLQDNLVAISNPQQVNNIKYQLTRTATVSSTSPFNVLQLTYSTKRDPNGGTNYTKEVATLYTEVIPDAAFKCN